MIGKIATTGAAGLLGYALGDEEGIAPGVGIGALASYAPAGGMSHLHRIMNNFSEGYYDLTPMQPQSKIEGWIQKHQGQKQASIYRNAVDSI